MFFFKNRSLFSIKLHLMCHIQKRNSAVNKNLDHYKEVDIEKRCSASCHF